MSSPSNGDPRARLALGWVDIVPALAAAAIGVASVLVPDPSVAYVFDASPLVVGVLASAATAPLLLRRLFPGAAYVVSLTAVSTIAFLPGPTGVLPGILAFALGWAAFAGALPSAVAVLLLTMLAFAVLGAAGAPYFDSPLALVTVVAFTASWALGWALRRWREIQRRRVAAAEAGRLDSERRAQAARGEERRRLARELHDSVTNSVAAIAVQAHLLQDGALDPGSHRVAEALEHESRLAFGELRRLLVVLRSEEFDADPAWTGADGPAQLDGVIASHRSLGGLIESRVDERLVQAPDEVRAAIGRVVAELLANARRHAPGAVVRLSIDVIDGGVRLFARNTVAEEQWAPTRPDSYGLLGIRERIASLGGSVRASRRDDEFHVLVEIPNVPAPAREEPA